MLGSLCLGDVPDGHHDRPALIGLQRNDGYVGGKLAEAAAAADQFHVAADQILLAGGTLVRDGRLAGEDRLDELTTQLVARITEQALRLRVGLGYLARSVHDQHRVGRALKELPELDLHDAPP